MKIYKTKATAKKGAARFEAKNPGHTATYKEHTDGTWIMFEGWGEDELFEDYGMVECPHCGVHLTNGVTSHSDFAHSNEKSGLVKHEHMCLGCGEEFGPLLNKKTSIKIEKDRPEQNDVVMPSSGGVCRQIWDLCDDHKKTTGTVPSVKHVRELAIHHNLNVNNSVIEYYQWRKFHGIIGRQS